MANKEKFNYAFLTAKPCAKLCGMSNSAFSIAVQHRLLLPIGNHWKFCACNEPIGPFFSHCYRCNVQAVKNPIRNELHKEFKQKFSDIVKARIAKSGLNCRVIDGEPKLEDYFNRLNPPPDPPDLLNNIAESSQFQRRGYENGVKVRADTNIQLTDRGKNIIIDFTFVEPTSRSYIGDYTKAGHAALKGVENKINNDYKHWNVKGNQVTNKFKVVSVETFGVIVKEDVIDIFQNLIHEKENKAAVLFMVLQQLSISFHSVRAKMFNKIKDNQARREISYQPVRNRERNIGMWDD
jgi:hypothetical protein